jgi:small subunit ribosomal protein S20
LANVASAEKRNRQRIKRREHNVFTLSTMRTSVKKFRTALEGKDKKAIETALKAAIRSVDMTAQKGVIKRETASRTISRLSLAANRA